MLTLDGGTQINSRSGTLTVESTGELPVTGSGATLDGVIVDDDNTGTTPVGIDVVSAADAGRRHADLGGLGGGTLTVETGGEITVNGSGATLDGVQVSDLNTGVGIDVVATLTLNDGTVISGGGNLTVDSAGQLDITAGTSADGATGGRGDAGRHHRHRQQHHQRRH